MYDALATALRAAADVRSGGLIAAGAGMEKPVIATSTGSPSVKLKEILSKPGSAWADILEDGVCPNCAMTKDFFDEPEPFNA